MAISPPRAVALIIVTAALGIGLSACGGTDASATTAEATPAEVTTRAATTAPESTEATTESTTASDPIATTGTDAPGSAVARFREDLQVIRTSIADIGAAVAAHPTAVGATMLSATVSASLQAFDRAVENMKGYTVESSAVEAYRTAIIAAAPALSDALRQFDDSVQQAGDSNSDATLMQAENQVGQALADFGTTVAGQRRAK